MDRGGFSSNGDGVFCLGQLEPGQYRINAAAAGYPSVGVGFSIDPLKGLIPEDLIVRLRAFWHIGGRVVDPEGLSVAGASVRVREGRYYAGRTDEDGRFSIGDIEPCVDHDETITSIDDIMVSASGYAPALLLKVEPRDELLIVLGRPGTLEVTVTLDGGDPPEGFSWSLKRESVSKETEPGSGTTFQRGRSAVVRDLPAGFYRVNVGSVGCRTEMVDQVALVEGATTQVQVDLKWTGQYDNTDMTLALKFPKKDSEIFRKQMMAFMANAGPTERWMVKELFRQRLLEEDEQDEESPEKAHITEEQRRLIQWVLDLERE